jgi:UPF0176 protein
MSALPVLYSFRRCPYAIRARLALRAAQVPVVLREVVLRDKPAEMLVISPKGTVPVLQLPGGQVIEQSLEIMRWALAQSDPEGWLIQGDPQSMQALIDINDGPFKALLDRYKYPERHPAETAEAYREQAVELFLARLEQNLSDRSCLLGPSPSLADMAIAPFVRQFAQVDADWFASASLPALRAWLQRIVGSPLFDAVMAKHAPWRPGDTATVF